MYQNVSRAILAAVLTFGLILAGCESSPTEPKDETPAPPVICEQGPFLIHLSGQCRAASSTRISCEDESTTTPQGKVRNVTFQLRDANTGTPVETKSVAGSTSPREISFSGVKAGKYEVRHTVQAADCSATFTTYDLGDIF